MSPNRVTLRNYRCFDWEHPCTIEFGDGFFAYIGPNNVGKSSALRAIYELRQYWGLIPITFQRAHQLRAQCSALGISDPTELANDHDPTRFEITLEVPDPAPQEFDLVHPATLIIVEATVSVDVTNQVMSLVRFRCKGRDDLTKVYDRDAAMRILTNDGHLCLHSDGNQIFTGAFQDFVTDLSLSRYYPAFRNAINEGAGIYYDLPVGTALVQTWDEWKAGAGRANKIAISRVEREIADLLGFQSLQINADKQGKTLDVIIDGRPQKLYEVGAGVAQLIIVFSAALVAKPPYILIDEPELSLHPSLQLNFLSTLGTYARKGLIFATHSLGLARSTAERITVVRKISSGVSEMGGLHDRKANFSEWLGELNYAGRMELGCEGVLFVEGPSELLCFQELLRKINKDQKYLLLSLGGSSLINANIAAHLSEITRLLPAKNIHAYIDSEKLNADEVLAPDRIAFLAGCESVGVHAQASELRATENYFETNGISEALGPDYSPLEPYQKLKDSVRPWKKSDNWKIARHTNFRDIEQTDLGQFLLSL